MATIPNPNPPLRDRSASRSQADPAGQNAGHPSGAFTLAGHSRSPVLNVVPAPDGDADDPGWEGRVVPAGGGKHVSSRGR